MRTLKMDIDAARELLDQLRITAIDYTDYCTLWNVLDVLEDACDNRSAAILSLIEAIGELQIEGREAKALVNACMRTFRRQMDCGTCKFCCISVSEEPCNACRSGESKWEPDMDEITGGSIDASAPKNS